MHAPGAFHNPEYCSRIHIYATSPGDNSAIMRRGRARVQLELPSSPPFPTNSPPCDFHSIPSTPIFLCLDALEIVPNLGPRASFLLLTLPRDLFNDATGKIRERGDASGPVQTANRIDYPPSSPRYPRAEIFVCTIRFSHAWRR